MEIFWGLWTEFGDFSVRHSVLKLIFLRHFYHTESESARAYLLQVPQPNYIRTDIWLMMMMNCFWGMVGRRKAFSLISSRNHCQRPSPSRISDTLRAGFEPAPNLRSGLVEWSCAVVITTTTRRHDLVFDYISDINSSHNFNEVVIL